MLGAVLAVMPAKLVLRHPTLVGTLTLNQWIPPLEYKLFRKNMLHPRSLQDHLSNPSDSVQGNSVLVVESPAIDKDLNNYQHVSNLNKGGKVLGEHASGGHKRHDPGSVHLGMYAHNVDLDKDEEVRDGRSALGASLKAHNARLALIEFCPPLCLASSASNPRRRRRLARPGLRRSRRLRGGLYSQANVEEVALVRTV